MANDGKLIANDSKNANYNYNYIYNYICSFISSCSCTYNSSCSGKDSSTCRHAAPCGPFSESAPDGLRTAGFGARRARPKSGPRKNGSVSCR